MTDQIGTPGSTADTSIYGGSKGNAPKDKACPFCHQRFTSSSLGRHLDLYIKDKNAKAPDGVHIVEEIRKLRGGITRRQPRNSTSKREISTPRVTPAPHEIMSPSPARESGSGRGSPSARRDDIGPSNLLNYGKPRMILNSASWEATGVMNNIPAAVNGDSRSWDSEERDGRRAEGRSRSVSKQVLAKAAFDQKQKLLDAADNAKAAELALREIMGSLRAAKQRIDGPAIFDYDPLTLDFPALCLHCLPPPPTLHTSIPIASPQSWNIGPPGDAQYNALRAHFSSAFRNHRIAIAIATTAPRDDLSYPPPPDNFLAAEEDPASLAAHAEAEATELESTISSHLHDAFAAWTSHFLQKRSEIWTLELARSAGRKDAEINKLKKQLELVEQKAAHLKLQNDELSRIQLPREFKFVPPQTVPISQDLLHNLANRRADPDASRLVGFSDLDRDVHVDTVIRRAIGRWKDIIKAVRSGKQTGMAAQRSLSGDSLHSAEDVPQVTLNSNTNSKARSNTRSNTNLNPHPATDRKSSNGIMEVQTTTKEVDGVGSDQDADADADADADMEDDISYNEIGGLVHGQPAPEAPMGQSAQNFRMTNGIEA